MSSLRKRLAARNCGITAAMHVHVVHTLAPGGIETLILDLAERDPTDTRIISLCGTADALIAAWPRLEAFSDQIQAVDKAEGLTPSTVLPLYRLFREMRPKAVYLHHLAPLVYGGVAARLAGVKRIVHVEHDVWHYNAPGNGNARRMLQAAEKIARPIHVGVSEAIGDWLRDELGEGADVHVIKPSVQIDRFGVLDTQKARALFSLPEDRFLIGSVGRLAEVKGHRHLIDAMADLPEDCHLALAGDGPERASLEALAEARGVAQRAHFLGNCDDVPAFLSALDMFCLPSLNEGLPRAIMEAAAADLPIVATDVGAVAQALHAQMGMAVDAGDSAALACALRDLRARCFNDQGRLEACCGLNRHHAEANFDFSQTRTLYRNLGDPQ